ncbi:hypothetical protein GCM10023196_033120 [Actinoallomurus vinaceus]|uniref:Intein C-terminal splicing domain-containing protein n=2 Tax=Actinoallomurus vinaceus TaxID=1080074 RepID=A0ABP8U835_9ACTN
MVAAIHVTQTDRDYTDVPVSTPTGPYTITGTSHHLYWDATTRAWTRADHLHAGDRIQTTQGHTAAIVALHRHTATMVTYNLTIDGLHTYYVEAGATPVLVHNCGDLGPKWKPRPASEICRSTGCEDVARQIQQQIGGEVRRIESPVPGGNLGRYRGQWTEWRHHEVVVRDGRVYDGFTGRTGLPIDEYKSLWTDLYPNEFPF